MKISGIIARPPRPVSKPKIISIGDRRIVVYEAATQFILKSGRNIFRFWAYNDALSDEALRAAVGWQMTISGKQAAA